MILIIRSFLLILFSAMILPPPSSAIDEQELDRIASLRMADLTQETFALLEEKYPDEDWNIWRFPSYVFTSRSVEAAYKIAVKEPDLLGNPDIAVKEQSIPCYCFCDAMGHTSLLHCFWKEGKAGGEFDDHGADCSICYGQAMLAFLWKNLGASDQEILKGMEKKFGHLPKPTPH